MLRSLQASSSPSFPYDDVYEIDPAGPGTLVDLGIMRLAEHLTCVRCVQCPEGCFIDVEHEIDGNGEMCGALGFCPDPGEGSRLIKVDPVRLKTWRVDASALAQCVCKWLGLQPLPASLASGYAWRLGDFTADSWSYKAFMAVGLASPSMPASALDSLRSAVKDTLSPLVFTPSSMDTSTDLLQSVPTVSLTSLLCLEQHGLGLNTDALKRHLASLRGDKELPTPPGYAFSRGYRAVRRLGTDYDLSPRQANVIKILHVAWAQGSPRLHHTEILKDDPATRMRDVFKNKLQVMRDLLTSDQHGYYELNIPKP